METLLIIIHVMVSFLLIVVVLLQSGKGGDLASAFGMTGSQTVFGPRGATTLLHKITVALAVLFMVTSLSLYLIQAKGPKSVVKGVAKKPPITKTQNKAKK